ncbi:MAG: choice-of-anchor X domain-containing protein [Gammaproteobacteria bacterium]
MRHPLRFTCGLLLLSFNMSNSALANNCPGNLDDTAHVVSNPPGIDYDVYFTDDDSSDPDFLDAGRAGQIRDSLVTNHNALIDATRNFRAPFFSDDPADTCIFDSRNVATAPEDRITVDAPSFVNASEPFIRFVMGHELFHHTQFAYIDFDEWPSWGGWTVEGSARYMEDKSFSDLDTVAMNSFFVGEINGYLGNPNRTLTDVSYPAVLFWNYLAEQLGSPLPEPARGVDFVERFWRNTDGHDPDSIRYLRQTIRQFDDSRTLEDLFIDFGIANYTHDLNVSSLPSPTRYQYFDESGAGGGTPYDAVARTAVPSINSVESDSVQRWGLRYLEADVISEQTCEAVGFWGKARDGRTLAWSIVAVKDGNVVSEVYRSIGNEFYRAIVNTPEGDYDRMALVVAGLGSGADFDYSFGWGPISGELRRPTLEKLAYVGSKEAPERFQSRLLIQGPASLTPSGSGPVSMRGLDASQFEVTLRSASTGAEYPAQVVNSNYVSGEYWLNIQAPEITDPSDGDLYDLVICFCKRAGQCSELLVSNKSVLYADIILNQMLVMDVSGSMAHPNSDPKLEAAKNAARLYADVVDDDDLLGFAIFTGNDTECDDDASVETSLDMAGSNRGDVIDRINNQVPREWTSIGDGIIAGRNELFGASGMADIRSIVLLSDGLENEGDFWDIPNSACGNPPVKESFLASIGGPAADMRIDTLAFGADADQRLLQDIANVTDGDYYAVSTDAPARSTASRSSANGSPSSASLAVPNRLANAYRTIHESNNGQERLFYRDYQVTGGSNADATIPVTEADGGGIERGVFAFNWNVEGGVDYLGLFDPDGNEVSNGGGWTVDETSTNKVYHFDGIIAPGNWKMAVEANANVEVLAMLSGRIRRGVNMTVDLSQVIGAQPDNCEFPLGYQYLRGLPVGIVANVTDKGGAISNLLIEAVVEGPNRIRNTLKLFDDGHHGDGVANDGIYGNATTRTPWFSSIGVPDFPDGPPTGLWGSYSVQVTATGTSNFGEEFERNRTSGFQVFEFGENTDCFADLDDDDLPDRWEDLYGLDKTDPLDGAIDHDNDGLDSKSEFFLGTHPFDPDTDKGGESDGSEVEAGRDPLYVSDDKIAPILDFGIVTTRTDLPIHEPVPETLILHFPVNITYAKMRIFRRDSPVGAFTQIDEVDLSSDPSGVYYDRNLTPGVVYEYYLVAEGLSGAISTPTENFGAEAKSDPLPPKGWVQINDNYPQTASPNVQLRFDISADATQIIYSQLADFSDASWVPLNDVEPYTLSVSTLPEVAIIFAKFRDASGNESVVYHDAILIDPNADNDADGVPDASDNCTLLANPQQRDTDGDGFGNLCDADFNNDLIINIVDLGVMRSRFFTTDPDTDLNGDGVTNVLDLGLLRQSFFGTPGPAGPVP